jgi:hypothetical protein
MKPPGYTVGYHGTPPTHPDDYMVMHDYQLWKKHNRRRRQWQAEDPAN